MKKIVVGAALLGALWMLFVLWIVSVRLAYATNYLGMKTLFLLPQAKGIAPPINHIVGNTYLVVTSALQWGVLAAIICVVVRRSRRVD